MDATDVIVLDGYLDEETVEGDAHCTTARFRLEVTPSEERVDMMVLPCSVRDWALARAVVALRPGDFVRVTGYLRLPATPDGPVWLEVHALQILAVLPPAPAGDPDGLHTEQPGIGDDALIERHGQYLLVHDPVGVTYVWTQTGAWVGETEDLNALADLLRAYEHHQGG